MAGMVCSKGLTRVRRALTAAECSRLLLATLNGPDRAGHSGRDRYWLWRFAIETGLRRQEIKSLTIADVDLKVGVVRVQAAFAKAGRTRIVPLSKDTIKGLRTHWRGRKAVEPAFHVPYRTVQVLGEDLKAARIVAGPGRVLDFHALRHTFCTNIGQRRPTLATAKKLMGHQSVEMTMRYMHSELDEMRRVVDGMV